MFFVLLICLALGTEYKANTEAKENELPSHVFEDNSQKTAPALTRLLLPRSFSALPFELDEIDLLNQQGNALFYAQNDRKENNNNNNRGRYFKNFYMHSLLDGKPNRKVFNSRLVSQLYTMPPKKLNAKSHKPVKRKNVQTLNGYSLEIEEKNLNSLNRTRMSFFFIPFPALVTSLSRKLFAFALSLPCFRMPKRRQRREGTKLCNLPPALYVISFLPNIKLNALAVLAQTISPLPSNGGNVSGLIPRMPQFHLFIKSLMSEEVYYHEQLSGQEARLAEDQGDGGLKLNWLSKSDKQSECLMVSIPGQKRHIYYRGIKSAVSEEHYEKFSGETRTKEETAPFSIKFDTSTRSLQVLSEDKKKGNNNTLFSVPIGVAVQSWSFFEDGMLMVCNKKVLHKDSPLLLADHWFLLQSNCTNHLSYLEAHLSVLLEGQTRSLVKLITDYLSMRRLTIASKFDMNSSLIDDPLCLPYLESDQLTGRTRMFIGATKNKKLTAIREFAVESSGRIVLVKAIELHDHLRQYLELDTILKNVQRYGVRLEWHVKEKSSRITQAVMTICYLNKKNELHFCQTQVIKCADYLNIQNILSSDAISTKILASKVVSFDMSHGLIACVSSKSSSILLKEQKDDSAKTNFVGLFSLSNYALISEWNLENRHIGHVYLAPSTRKIFESLFSVYVVIKANDFMQTSFYEIIKFTVGQDMPMRLVTKVPKPYPIAMHFNEYVYLLNPLHLTLVPFSSDAPIDLKMLEENKLSDPENCFIKLDFGCKVDMKEPRWSYNHLLDIPTIIIKTRSKDKHWIVIN